jgi:hypothetical protein
MQDSNRFIALDLGTLFMCQVNNKFAHHRVVEVANIRKKMSLQEIDFIFI